MQYPTIATGSYTLTAQALHWLTVLWILMILPQDRSGSFSDAHRSASSELTGIDQD